MVCVEGLLPRLHVGGLVVDDQQAMAPLRRAAIGYGF
jgi:hypothetical protein